MYAIWHGRDGRVGVGTERGFHLIERRGDRFRELARGGSFRVDAFARDPSGTLWMGTDAGLKYFLPDSPTVHRTDLPKALDDLADVWIRSLFVDRAGDLWIGTNGYGVYRYDGARAERYAVENGLAGNNVLDITEDVEGNLWFATTTGVSKLSTRQVMSYTVRDGLIHNSVMCIAQDRAGDYWVGTTQGVSRVSDGRVVNSPDGFGLGDTFTLFAIRDRRGGVWMGSELGLSRLDDGRFDTLGPEDGWTVAAAGWNRARSLWEDDRGWVWAANDWGLSVFKDERVHTFSFSAEGDSFACAVLADLRGDVWLGFHSGNGILRLGVEDLGPGLAPLLDVREHYSAPHDIPDGRIVSRERDRDGHLWFGTRAAGAVRFVMTGGEVASIERYSTANGLANDYVRTIMQDSRGTIWIGTDKGVNYLPAEVQGRTMFRHLAAEDGLPGSVAQFCYEDDKGDIWICTTNGIARYEPDVVRSPPVSPRVYINRFSVFGEPDEVALGDGRAELSHDRHSLTFEFVAVTYKGERKPRYRYRLEGADEGWSKPTSSRRVNYAHLRPGSYRFEVIAENSDGLWSAEPATFLVAIATPFWQEWWFLTLAVAVAGCGVYAAHRYRVRRILEVENVRRRIAADLHDDVGSTLSSISILSEIAIAKSGHGPGERTGLLERIHDDSRQMIEAMDDIVWAIRPQDDGLDALIARMTRLGAEIMEPRGVDFSLEAAGVEGLRLPMVIRRDVYLVFKEALTNAARHAACRTARVVMAWRDRSLVLTVTDDGRGFANEKREDGDGLENMKRRAESMKGSLKIRSVPGEGTCIILTVPLTRRRR